MTLLLLAIALGVMALPLVTSPAPSQGRIHASGFNGASVVIGFMVTIAVVAVTSPLFGFGFILAFPNFAGLNGNRISKNPAIPSLESENDLFCDWFLYTLNQSFNTKDDRLE